VARLFDRMRDRWELLVSFSRRCTCFVILFPILDCGNGFNIWEMEMNQIMNTRQVVHSTLKSLTLLHFFREQNWMGHLWQWIMYKWECQIRGNGRRIALKNDQETHRAKEESNSLPSLYKFPT
jgi:hypothetical protein